MQQPAQQNNKLYVGNLNFEATEADVNELFSTFGVVKEAKIVMDRFSGKSRGFAFVTFEEVDPAYKAKDALNGQAYQGKTLVIDFAKIEERTPRPTGDRPRPAGGGYGAPRRDFGGNDRGGNFRGNERGNDRGGYRGKDDRGGFRGGDRNDRYSK